MEVIDMAAGGLDVDPKAKAEVCAVLAFWAHQEKIHLLENGLKVLKMAF